MVIGNEGEWWDGLQLKFFDKLPFCHHSAYRGWAVRRSLSGLQAPVGQWVSICRSAPSQESGAFDS